MDINIPADILSGTISGKRNKENKYEKGKIQLIKKGELELIQLAMYTKTQVFHTNYTIEEFPNVLRGLLESDFNNLELITNEFNYSYRVTSKGKLLSNRKRNNNTQLVNVSASHNKKKNYLLPEGEVIEPLVDLGVMLPDGRIVKASYDKYKQINRFLEIIDDSIKDEEELKIIDFGCGKSYLTFILYYYLVKIKKMKCEIIGLDLKEQVIEDCNRLAKKYGYDGLHFLCGDIAKYKDTKAVDMIITLHACDTATDYALYHAINMHCRYIFSVPCCQHEINSELGSDKMHLVTKFGILKERMSAIMTDAIRANLLQYSGYKTQIMEFVDIENSPKNLLIRATYTGSKNTRALAEVEELLKEYNIKQTMYELLISTSDAK